MAHLIHITMIVMAIAKMIIGQLQHSNFNYDTNPQYYVGLNNEFAELPPSAYKMDGDADNVKRMQAIKYVIGYLPFNEQIALLNSIGDLFNQNEYLTKIGYPDSEPTPPALFEKNIFVENSKALSSYITESVKRLNKGMGCIKNIVNKYGHDLDVDEIKVKSIYKAMNEIFEAQNKANFCSAKFLKVLQTTMIMRRDHLFSIKTEEINIDPEKDEISSSSNLIYGDAAHRTVVGIKYTDSELAAIVPAFKEYATCQHTYRNVLSRKAIEIEQQIGQLNRCLNKKNPNPYAGNSSMVSQFPNITYDNHGQQIGVNNVTMVRPDQRTTNNYLLNWGFGLGKINTRENDQITLPYPKHFNDAFFKQRLDKLTDLTNTMFDSFKVYFKDIATPSQQYKPFANIMSLLINTAGAIGGTDAAAFITELKLFETTTQPLPTADGIFECTSANSAGTTCQCTICSSSTISINLLNPITNFLFTDITIYIIHLIGLPPMLVIKAKSPETGDIFDIHSQGINLGTQSMSSIQGCFGVFTSGGNNDKDACREPLTEECGDDLDYQCKNSGLYDFINEQPVTSSALPYNCTLVLPNGSSNDLPCLQWIDKYFISGTIAVKPSAFAAYALNAQSGMIESPNINDPDNYKPAKAGNTITSPVIKDQLTKLAEDVISKDAIYVYKSTSKTQGNYGIQILQTNSEYMNIFLSSSFFLSFISVISISLLFIF